MSLLFYQGGDCNGISVARGMCRHFRSAKYWSWNHHVEVNSFVLAGILSILSTVTNTFEHDSLLAVISLQFSECLRSVLLGY